MINFDISNMHTCNAGAWPAGAVRCGWRHAAGAAAIVAMLTGCSSFGSLTGESSPPPAPASTGSTAPPSSNGSFTSRVKSLFAGDSGNLNSPAPQAAAEATVEINCPSVEYRQGAATLAVNSQGTENAALGLRYQASFVQTARECILRGNDLTIKVGVQGRIVVGPAGGPGPVSIPLRYALVREGAEPRTLWTKLFVVPVTIPANQLNLPWLHVEEEMKVPRPPGDEIDSYVIYIGFDPEGAAAPKPAAKPRSPRAR
jgi:hypothetical protein